jgi:predicted NAD/FAD-binding protein
VTFGTGQTEHFDRVILACHADQALRLLQDPRPDEARLLGAFRYQPNTATLHTDTTVMPRTRLAWSSWNYEIATTGDDPATATHYWMNALQGVSDRENYFVSINRPGAIDPSRVLRRLEYDHPLFDLAALAAQPQLPGLNAAALGSSGTFFAGSYFRYGFHEDALLSAHQVAGLLIGRDPWPEGEK